jgi:predicted Fe-Mo cluster-binding NifX family protein
MWAECLKDNKKQADKNSYILAKKLVNELINKKCSASATNNIRTKMEIQTRERRTVEESLTKAQQIIREQIDRLHECSGFFFSSKGSESTSSEQPKNKKRDRK